MKYPLQSVLFAVLAGVTVNVHALCVNPDGSLDDASVSREPIAVDVLPACKDQEATGAGTPQGDEAAGKQLVPAQPADVAKIGNKRTALDCQTANGESRVGYLGAAELLPVCNL